MARYCDMISFFTDPIDVRAYCSFGFSDLWTRYSMVIRIRQAALFECFDDSFLASVEIQLVDTNQFLQLNHVMVLCVNHGGHS